MEDKFLNREGLGRFFEKIKSKFAPIDSPSFSGTPTVETLEFEKFSSGKEVINREYASNMFKAVMDYIESEKSAFHIQLNIKPNEWEKSEGVFKFNRLKEKIQNVELDKVSIFVRIDALRLEPKKLAGIQKYPLGITNELVIYTTLAPTYELPIIVDLFVSMDMTMWLGGN